MPTTPPDDHAATLHRAADDADDAFRATAPDEPVLPCEKQKLVIQLLGEDDLPMAGERYHLVLDDGSNVEGRLDARGIAVREGVSGPCKVSFPDLDSDVWERMAS